ncbi:MAG: hypothetical protein QGH76_06605 [Phycisphaerales bacterium]|nr:hypothetical protein [Phycisphaerales bacterium]
MTAYAAMMPVALTSLMGVQHLAALPGISGANAGHPPIRQGANAGHPPIRHGEPVAAVSRQLMGVL